MSEDVHNSVTPVMHTIALIDCLNRRGKFITKNLNELKVFNAASSKFISAALISALQNDSLLITCNTSRYNVS